MTTRDLARLFIRFQALCFLFWAFYDLLQAKGICRDFQLIHEYKMMDSIAAETFWVFVIRILVQILVAMALFRWTDPIINLLTLGKWTSTPPSSPPAPPAS